VITAVDTNLLLDMNFDGARFVDSAELYDAIYHFKDYARECERLRKLIEHEVSGARTVLDVACGTGGHARFLKDHYEVDGVDLNEGYLRAARARNPAGTYTRADMTDFNVGRTYDAVICLFSAIGNVGTVQRLARAVACMARHVRSRGVLIVEPWFTPDKWNPGGVFIHAGEIGVEKVCRMSLSSREGNLSILQFHYLRGTPTAIEHYSERLELTLFTRDDMTRAFESAGMQVRYDPQGLMGRGLYIAKPRR
jgi:ubiquinone/menaquinone biosynthesis C-methylase UbiE